MTTESQHAGVPGTKLIRRTDDPGIVDAGKRRFSTLALSLAPASLGLVSGFPSRAGAANPKLPPGVRSLDSAGMALFDAAEATNWPDAEQALQHADAAALVVGGLKWSFVDASGSLNHFIQVQNNLSGDLVEAKLALSTKDQRWLINSADRIDSRAGELSEPFLNKGDRFAPRVETLLYLARRMRRALIWHDDGGYRQASDDFTRVSAPLLRDLNRERPAQAKTLDSAVKRLGVSPSSADLKSVYADILTLRDTPRAEMTGK